ncbi:MAG: acetolactate decarboxylase [Ignavibacteria bacterium]|nr:acetolactate decarboxylase [Ignavibacteria bacterium]
MKIKSVIVFILFFIGIVSAQSDALTQFSTIDALLNGLYDGQFSFGEVIRSGDFGIGTFNALDGEMVLLDGEIFQITADGGVNLIDSSVTTPFSVSTFFDSDNHFKIDSCQSLEELIKILDSKIVSGNIFYAVKISGNFLYVKTRSVPKQNKPYLPLTEAAKHQTVFEKENLKGDLIGFYSPVYVKGINVPGYHLHFLSKDKTFGGHVLDVKIDKVECFLDEISSFKLILPDDDEFLNTDLSKDKEDELKSVEKGN